VANESSDALLIRVSGADRPGITADLMTLLELTDTSVQDVEQVLVRGHLTLAVAIAKPDSTTTRLAEMLDHFGHERRLKVTLEDIPPPRGSRGNLDAVTVLGHALETELSPAELGAVAGAVVAAGANIERIVRLARYPVFAYEFLVRGADRVELSAREYQLLRYLIEHRNEVVSRDQLLNEVWGYNAMPSTRTVDVHVAWLRQKIEPNPRHPQFLLTVHGLGYRFVG